MELQKGECVDSSHWAMAQDFYAIFKLGNSDKSISSIDPSGIALIGVQVLAKAFKAQQQQMEANVRMFKTMQGEIEKIDMTFNDVKTNNHLGIKLDELQSDY